MQNVKAESPIGRNHAHQGRSRDSNDGGRHKQIHRSHDAYARGHSCGEYLVTHGETGTDRYESNGAVRRKKGRSSDLEKKKI